MEVEIRGHDQKLMVYTAEDPTVFASLLDPQEPPDIMEEL
jgi:hypothetical protein